MKLYHATTVYQFLNVVAHIQKDNSFGQDVILFSPWMKEKFANPEILKKFFKKIHYYDAAIFKIPVDRLEEKIIENIDAFLAKKKINLELFDEIIVGGAQYNFGIYLCSKKIPFSAIEESCGIYSYPEVIYNIDKKIPSNEERVVVAKALGIYELNNDAITRVYCDKDAQKEGFESDKIYDFKVLEILKTMDSEKIDTLLQLFGIDKKIQLDENSVFLMTQQFSSLHIMDFKSQVLIYQLFCDFFVENKAIYVKSHPDDVCHYSWFLKNASVITEKFPSELTPFVFESLPKSIATISSTGIKPLRYLFDEAICLDFKFEKNFRGIIKYYTALEHIKKTNIRNFKLVEADSALLSELLKKCGMNNCTFENVESLEEMEYSPETAVIIDRCLHDDSLQYVLGLNFDLYIFLNTDGSFSFYRYEFKDKFDDKLIPIVISKKQIREDECYLELNEEMIFAYTDNKEISEAMKDVDLSKELENTGISFKVENLTDEQLEIYRLRGILEATEKRLLYYINKEKEAEQDK